MEKLTSKKPGPDLQPVEGTLEVDNGKYETEWVVPPGEDGPYGRDGSQWNAVRQSDQSKARIKLYLHNKGDRRSVITGAIFTLRKFVAVPPCGVGAGIMVSASYDVELPRDLAEGQTVEVPMKQQVGPDETDGVERRVGREFADEDMGLEYLYQLDIALRHDDLDKPLAVGTVLIELPGTADDPTFMLSNYPEYVVAHGAAARLDGIRSPQLTNLLDAAGRQA
jgi:hypothetical protein